MTGRALGTFREVRAVSLGPFRDIGLSVRNLGLIRKLIRELSPAVEFPSHLSFCWTDDSKNCVSEVFVRITPFSPCSQKQ